MATFNFNKWNTITGWFAFAIALVTYTLTVEPTMSFWDCGEFVSSCFKLQVPHPPGAPMFVLLGRFFIILFGEIFSTSETTQKPFSSIFSKGNFSIV